MINDILDLSRIEGRLLDLEDECGQCAGSRDGGLQCHSGRQAGCAADSISRFRPIFRC
jgi:hypothetical protein